MYLYASRENQPHQALRQCIDIVAPHSGVVLPGEPAQLLYAQIDGLLRTHCQQQPLLQPELVNDLLPCLFRYLKCRGSCAAFVIHTEHKCLQDGHMGLECG